MAVDLTDYGQVVDALGGVRGEQPAADAVVHLAAIPAPGLHSDVATFRNNMLTTFHVLHAATRLGISKVVMASSETVLGLPFDTPPPYVPVDEEYPGGRSRCTPSASTSRRPWRSSSAGGTRSCR